MIEYDDVEQRRTALAELLGAEDKLWMQVDGYDKVWAIADEDLERETDDKTSAVHFLRFELSSAMVTGVREGATISAGIEHENYCHQVVPVADNIRASLVEDLE